LTYPLRQTLQFVPGVRVPGCRNTVAVLHTRPVTRISEITSSGAQDFPVAISRRLYPIPFRTRKSSFSEPMVLHGLLCGRVGRCRDYFARLRWKHRGLVFFCALKAILPHRGSAICPRGMTTQGASMFLEPAPPSRHRAAFVEPCRTARASVAFWRGILSSRTLSPTCAPSPVRPHAMGHGARGAYTRPR
jgi:hypothetical protein